MKAISLWQPWASAIADGKKKIETRSWYTKYRGPLLIHATKKIISTPERIVIKSLCNQYGYNPYFYAMPYGEIICRVVLVHCKLITIYNIPDGLEMNLGDYTQGRFMWIIDHLKKFKTPIPFRGSQGFFEVPDELMEVKNEL